MVDGENPRGAFFFFLPILRYFCNYFSPRMCLCHRNSVLLIKSASWRMIHLNPYYNAQASSHAPKGLNQRVSKWLNQCSPVCAVRDTQYRLATGMPVTVISSPEVIYGFPKNKRAVSLVPLAARQLGWGLQSVRHVAQGRAGTGASWQRWRRNGEVWPPPAGAHAGIIPI